MVDDAYPCRLYLITPPSIEIAVFCEELKAALQGGPVAALQLRLKDVPDQVVLAAGEALLAICHDAGTNLIVNDRPDLAQVLGADGVHVGQQDASYEDARTILGPDKAVGVTCHDSRHLAMEAAECGADYVAFGAFYPTQTKEAPTRTEPSILEWWSLMMEVPCVAIGGITVENAAPLVAAGADFLAVSGGVWGHAAGPEAAVRAFDQLFQA